MNPFSVQASAPVAPIPVGNGESGPDPTDGIPGQYPGYSFSLLPPAPDGTHWVSSLNDDKRIVWHAVPDASQMRDAGWFGRKFQEAGYKYLGPGTDLAYNESHNIQPIDDLDQAAKVHDYDYMHIKDAFERGDINFAQAAKLVDDADRDLIYRAMSTGKIPGILTALGMGAKDFWDYFTGPSFAEIYPQNYGKNKYNPGQGVGPADPSGYPPEDPSEDPYYPGWLSDSSTSPDQSGHEPPAGMQWFWNRAVRRWDLQDYFDEAQWIRDEEARSRFRAPVSVIDVNNNGVPDVMERKRKRRRHRNTYGTRPY